MPRSRGLGPSAFHKRNVTQVVMIDNDRGPDGGVLRDDAIFLGECSRFQISVSILRTSKIVINMIYIGLYMVCVGFVTIINKYNVCNAFIQYLV